MSKQFGDDNTHYDDCPWRGGPSLGTQCLLQNEMMMAGRSHDIDPNYCWFRGDNETIPDELFGVDPNDPKKQQWVERVKQDRCDCILRRIAGDTWKTPKEAGEFLKRLADTRRRAEEDRHHRFLDNFLGINFGGWRRKRRQEGE